MSEEVARASDACLSRPDWSARLMSHLSQTVTLRREADAATLDWAGIRTGWTDRSRRSLKLARDEADQRGDLVVTTADLLIGLARESTVALAGYTLDVHGLTPDLLRKQLGRRTTTESLPATDAGSASLLPSASLLAVLESAGRLAQQRRHNNVGTESLLLALLALKGSMAVRLLEELGVGPALLEREINRLLGDVSTEVLPAGDTPAEPERAELVALLAETARRLSQSLAGDAVAARSLESICREVEQLRLLLLGRQVAQVLCGASALGAEKGVES